MPFEIAPKEVSIADKLAALIEAGRAMHPDWDQARGKWRTSSGGCAMTFALAAAGITAVGKDGIDQLAAHLGDDPFAVDFIARQVINANDFSSSSIPEITQALRDKTISQLGSYIGVSLSESFQLLAGMKVDCKWMVTIVGDPVVAWDLAITSHLPKTTPAKKLRQSGKTGKCWPVAKHAYA